MNPTKNLNISKLQYLPVAFSFPCPSGQSIGQCISGIYTWSLTVVGILAFFQIIYAGVMYLTAAGNASRISQAKSKIWKAILGIIILFSSYLILYTINPDLVGGTLRLPDFSGSRTEKRDYDTGGINTGDEELPDEGTGATGGGDDLRAMFDQATPAEFIKSISLSKVTAEGEANVQPGKEIQVEAKRLYAVGAELDPNKFIPLLLDKGDGSASYAPEMRVTSSEPVEWVRLGLIPGQFDGYPGEWSKLSGFFNSFKDRPRESFHESFGNKSINTVISENIKSGTEFFMDTFRFDGSVSPGAAARIFKNIKFKGNLFIPQSQLGKKIELKLTVLGQDKDKNLVKDEETLILNVTKVNQAPKAADWARICANTIHGGKQECQDGKLEEAGYNSPFEVFLSSGAGKPLVSDPDGEKISCGVLFYGVQHGKLYARFGTTNREACNNTSKIWIQMPFSIGLIGYSRQANVITQELSQPFLISDGTLLEVSQFGLIFGLEPGKVYINSPCDPNKDGDKDEIYASGAQSSLSCLHAENGPWKWSTVGSMDSPTVEGCSITLGKNAIVEGSPKSSIGKWQCLPTPGYQQWTLQPVGGQKTKPPGAKLIESLVPENQVVKKGDKVVLKAKLDEKLDPSNIRWLQLKIGGGQQNPDVNISSSFDSSSRIAQAEFTAPNIPVSQLWIQIRVGYKGIANADESQNFFVEVK